ncbi:hypothetical protein PABY_06970 [Pyrodictium abyssi]|uniref:Uncharacterized protein n=1 Tax=Pyrodictium abyssi TaxID=54256 RepID=A0ABN6ZRR3_9CREN|nr:hypothetical protein PABY_06970 [Pyrodictium abyssi]
MYISDARGPASRALRPYNRGARGRPGAGPPRPPAPAAPGSAEPLDRRHYGCERYEAQEEG